jgi:Tol biopolymer transport system component
MFKWLTAVVLLLVVVNETYTLQAWEAEIVYAADVEGNIDIYVMNADGSNSLRLTNHPAEDKEPAWSPDRRQIAFVSNRDGAHEIYLMNADGSNQRRLSNDGATTGSPSWSPDGQHIAYHSYRGGQSRIYVISTSTGSTRSLTSGNAEDIEPAWSPDGRRIVFASDRGGNFEIYVMDTNGANVRRLSNNPQADNRSPAWSLDGTHIAFVSTIRRDSEINIMNADGTGLRTVAVNPDLFAEAVTWSPDGQWLAYMVLTVRGERYIQMSGVDMFASRRLANGTGWPSWASLRPLQSMVQTKPSSHLSSVRRTAVVGNNCRVWTYPDVFNGEVLRNLSTGEVVYIVSGPVRGRIRYDQPMLLDDWYQVSLTSNGSPIGWIWSGRLSIQLDN